jgi:hypothetical protein
MLKGPGVPRMRKVLIGSMLLLGGAALAWAQGAILGRDGCVEPAVFERDWRKYSDIDERIPLESRSWAAQQYSAAREEIREAQREIVGLTAAMELDREWRLAARDYDQALTRGMKANLLKAFWRLAWITYNTTGGPTGGPAAMVNTSGAVKAMVGNSTKGIFGFVKPSEVAKAGKGLAEFLVEPFTGEFLTDASKLATGARVIGLVKKFIPKRYSKLPGNEGKVVNVGVEAVLEGVKNLDEPELQAVKVVVGTITKGAETAGKELLGSADLSDEEVAVLRQQHQDKQHIQKALEENYRLNSARAQRIEELRAQIREAEKQEKEAERRERSRVFAKLNAGCAAPPKLQFALSVDPPRVLPGAIATVTVRPPGGFPPDAFSYAWVLGEGGATAEGVSTVRFQSARPGRHTVTLVIRDARDPANPSLLGQMRASVDVGDMSPPPPPPPAAAGPIQVKVLRLEVTPQTLIPGDQVTCTVHYAISGVPANDAAPLAIRFVVSGGARPVTKDLSGKTGSGTGSAWTAFATAGAPPGRYPVQATVSVGASHGSGDGFFIVRQPDVVAPPPPRPREVQPHDFVGDWEGRATVVEGSNGLRPGQTVPARFRIVQRGDRYHVYDLQDPSTPTVPMTSRMDNRQVTFYYRGPAIDTKGYAHDDMPMELRWTLALQGNSVSGRMVMQISGERMVMDVQAARAR